MNKCPICGDKLETFGKGIVLAFTVDHIYDQTTGNLQQFCQRCATAAQYGYNNRADNP